MELEGSLWHSIVPRREKESRREEEESDEPRPTDLLLNLIRVQGQDREREILTVSLI